MFRAMKLLLIDDHPMVLDGLAELLTRSASDIDVLTARDARQGFKLLESHADIDVVLLDLRLPGLSGHDAIAQFGRLRPALPIIVLSSSDPLDVRKAIGSGALGYVPKSASKNTLMSAIHLVMNGELYVPSLMLDRALDEPKREGRAASVSSKLTERQVEVLFMLSQGQSNKAIAAKLNLSEKTVKIHVSAIFKALNVVNRTQAAAVGRESGLI